MKPKRIFALLSLAILINIDVSARTSPSDTIKHHWLPKPMTSVDLRVNIFGPFMNVIGMGFDEYEAAIRIGLWNRLYPNLEFGYGKSDYRSEATGFKSKCQSPFFRVGALYNFTKPNKHDSRFTIGVHYGFSTYNYHVDASNIKDPVWQETIPLNLSTYGSLHWMEMGIGVETRLWRFIHVGWEARLKFRLAQDAGLAEPWYVPGYGRNGGMTWGAKFNLIFDI